MKTKIQWTPGRKLCIKGLRGSFLAELVLDVVHVRVFGMCLTSDARCRVPAFALKRYSVSLGRVVWGPAMVKLFLYCTRVQMPSIALQMFVGQSSMVLCGACLYFLIGFLLVLCITLQIGTPPIHPQRLYVALAFCLIDCLIWLIICDFVFEGCPHHLFFEALFILAAR